MRGIKICILLAIIMFLANYSNNIVIGEALSEYNGIKYANITRSNILLSELIGSSVGDRTASASGPYDTVIVHQAVTASWTYNEDYGYCDPLSCTWVTSSDHRIEVDVYQTPSPLRITDPVNSIGAYIHDSSGSGGLLPYIISYAMNTLWNIATTLANLPLPSPWALMQAVIDGNEPDVEVIRHSDLEGVSFIYNVNLPILGADWLWYIEKPVEEGWYLVDVYVNGTVSIGHYDWYTGLVWYEDVGSPELWFFADFEVRYI